MAEIASSLLRLEGEKIEVVSNGDSVISDEDLEVLLDRRPEVFAERGEGWTSHEGVQENKAAFAVYNAVADEGNDALAKMMGEDAEC
jgi:ATP-dependent DNA helicase